MNSGGHPWRAFAVALIFATTPLFAQQPSDDAERLRALEQRLEQLDRESKQLRQELEQLKGTPAPAAEATAPAAEDLTAIEAVPSQPAPAPSPEPPPSEALPTEVVSNPASPGASKVFNPDISVVGNIVGRAGDTIPGEEDVSPLTLEESEIAFEAFVDPYAKAKVFLAASEDGVEVEEGFINFISLPWDLTAKAGKFKQTFGKVNTFHPHVLPWVDLPLVVTNFLGPEGLKDHGISVSHIFPNRFDVFTEATVEVASGRAEDVFEPASRNDLSYLAHLKLYRDFTDNSNIEVGGSLLSGTVADAGASRFGGIDVTYRWKPLERAIYRSLIARAEMMVNDREGLDERALGWYASANYQFARRWFAGVRLDDADRVDDPSINDRGASLILTFWPSEFSQLRGQYRRTSFGNGPDANELLLQVQFSIGAHGGHPF
jgi:hypothetical protein